ncbi:hypothetical protein AB840_14740 [Megasphaera cerevisiae DSM 20462]|jgi:hypothetical protein|uniref:Uncharacterized protein n=2 Tax=Megasphaera TaxID=906 RepID=A0A0J6WPA5_9FIRM|nr:hypothetical protein AB840_14740 [Megasphaera cerevisiae DSM 20462]
MKICNNCKRALPNPRTICPFCGSSNLSPYKLPGVNKGKRQEKNRPTIKWNSTKPLIIFLIVACFFCIGIYSAYNYSPRDTKQNSTNNVTKPVPPSETKKKEAKQPSVLTNYGDKHDEILKAFNFLFSDNDYTPIYEGVTHDPAIDTLTVYVNNNWNLLSKDVKLSFIKTCFVAWQTATTSRQIKTNTTSFSLDIINKSSGRKVASWGSVRGPVLYDE